MGGHGSGTQARGALEGEFGVSVCIHPLSFFLSPLLLCRRMGHTRAHMAVNNRTLGRCLQAQREERKEEEEKHTDVFREKHTQEEGEKQIHKSNKQSRMRNTFF